MMTFTLVAIILALLGINALAVLKDRDTPSGLNWTLTILALHISGNDGLLPLLIKTCGIW